jgi:hypothetical protein
MDSFKKRQKELKRLEKQRDKAAKRLERKLHRGAPGEEPVASTDSEGTDEASMSAGSDADTGVTG